MYIPELQICTHAIGFAQKAFLHPYTPPFYFFPSSLLSDSFPFLLLLSILRTTPRALFIPIQPLDFNSLRQVFPVPPPEPVRSLCCILSEPHFLLSQHLSHFLIMYSVFGIIQFTFKLRSESFWLTCVSATSSNFMCTSNILCVLNKYLTTLASHYFSLP